MIGQLVKCLGFEPADGIIVAKVERVYKDSGTYESKDDFFLAVTDGKNSWMRRISECEFLSQVAVTPERH